LDQIYKESVNSVNSNF